jgi:uncharacterized protein YjiS (DUF1127 family)
MDSPRRAILIAGLSATAEARSRTQSYSQERIRGPSWRMRFWRWCVQCSSRARQRVALSELDDRLLDDVGLTRQQASTEAAKPFWK